jgi:hypothetical protein
VRKGHQQKKKKILLAEVRRKDYKFYPSGVGSGGIRYLFDWSQVKFLRERKRKKKKDILIASKIFFTFFMRLD